MDKHKHNKKTYWEYSSPSRKVLAKNIKEFRILFRGFCDYYEYKTYEFHVDEELLVKAFLKTDRQKLRFKVFHGMQLSELKIAGLLAYWFVRYKPLVYGKHIGIDDDGKPIYKFTTCKCNERFALYLMLTVLENYSIRSNKEFFVPTERQINNLHHIVLHRALSEDLMSMMLEPIGETLKINANSPNIK